MEPVVPFGLGIEYQLHKRWSLNLEGTLRPVKSDQLDANVGGFAYDIYSYNFVGITYHFIKRDKRKPEIPPRVIAYEEPIDVPEPVFKPAPIKEPLVDSNRTLEEKLLETEMKSGQYESPWPGVEFRVQIAASKTIDDSQKLGARMKLPGEIKVNEGDGWYRFSTGNFIKYWKAKDYRNILVTRYNIKDAFVVAYKDGKRINLGELVGGLSLLATGQVQEADKRPEIEKSFGVQLLASQDGTISTNAIKEMFEIEDPVYIEFKDGLYLYSVGNYNLYSDAAKTRDIMKAHGISGAFIVGYKNGKRVKEIKEILD